MPLLNKSDIWRLADRGKPTYVPQPAPMYKPEPELMHNPRPKIEQEENDISAYLTSKSKKQR